MLALSYSEGTTGTMKMNVARLMPAVWKAAKLKSSRHSKRLQ